MADIENGVQGNRVIAAPGGAPRLRADARRNLPSLVDEAQSGSEVRLTRRGKAVAVVVSVEAYERLKSQRGSFGEAYQAFREKYPADRIAGEQVAGPTYFRGLRDRSRGRKVEL